MATIKCNCYGALGSVAGPLGHCPMPIADGSYYQNYPFYNGPCPPGPNRPCCRPCCGCCGAHPPRPTDAIPAVTNRCAALFTCGAPGCIDAKAAVPIAAQLINPEYFAAAQDGLVIRRAGLYMAILCINLPPEQNICTTFSLCMNGTPIDAAQIRCVCASESANSSYTGQALIQASPNCLLTLNTERNVSIEAAAPTDNVFSLSVVRID